MENMTRILFLCTGNSCRSQMAEAWCRHLWPNDFDCWSAGIEKHGLNPHAVSVMQEIGIDMSRQFSKTVEDLADKNFDLVITVCGHANENCPVFPGPCRIEHRGFDDPPKLAASARSPAEALDHYRRVRDEIGEFVSQLPGMVNPSR